MIRTCIAAAAALLAAPASADHHLLKRALQEARCTPREVREVSNAGGSFVYEARCIEGGNRVLALVCTATRCLADDHGRHSPDDEDEP